eukprot:s34_g5.t1
MLRGANAGHWLEHMQSRSIDPGIQGVGFRCARKGDAAGAKRHFAAMEAAGYQADLKGFGALIMALSWSGEAKEALKMLEVVQEQSLQADGKMYHQVLTALAKSPDLDKVPELFRRMVADGIAPGPAAFSSLRKVLGSEESKRICNELGISCCERYIPAFDQAKLKVLPKRGQKENQPCEKAVTLRQLLTHTSGIGYGATLDDPWPPEKGAYYKVFEGLSEQTKNGEINSLETWCNELARVPLKGQPGRFWDYSYSLDVIGRVGGPASGAGASYGWTWWPTGPQK